MDQLNDIISKTTETPTIVNNESSFVVVTYWWGRGNLNNNTARPCVSYYEMFFKRVLEICIKFLVTVNNLQPENLNFIKEKLENVSISKEFMDLLKREVNEYLRGIYFYANIDENSKDPQQEAMEFLEKQKSTGKTPETYEFKNKEYLTFMLYFIAVEFIKLNKPKIIELYDLKSDVANLKIDFINHETNKDYKNKLAEFNNKKTEITNLIKRSLNTKITYEKTKIAPNKNITNFLNKIYDDPAIQNKSLNEILISELRYLNPIRFEEMIENWQNQCAENNCNYMSVEYSQFAMPGGYQMAINAKPLFIQKCLQLCGGRSVLYIDGDMNIRKYPILFDLPDVDYMARGWWIDPRSSYKLDESITYDPYTFETSGGTMFFSNSFESNTLLNAWIMETNKSYQKGKADDRIISMIFNSKKMLLNMKIIQLPVEYLWLTLDYHDRLLESDRVYDYDITKMVSSIIIDHPECLTSEDTASGSGASNDRSPKFYDFLYENIDPVSEKYYEYLSFEDPKYIAGLESYFKYMSDVYYIDDGNNILYAKGLVEKGNKNEGDNAQPLYIFPFENKFTIKGKDKDGKIIIKDNRITELSDIIVRRASTMNTQSLYTFNADANLAIIENSNFMKEEDPSKSDTVKLISLIYNLLNSGKNVLYKPPTTDNTIYENFMTNLNTRYKNTEFAFVPIFNGISYNDIYRPMVDVKQCIYIKNTSQFMKKFITMFESIQDLSAYINEGSYQLMSGVRVAYLIKPRIQKIIGGDGEEADVDAIENIDFNNFEKIYTDAVEYIENVQPKSLPTPTSIGGKFKKTVKKYRKLYKKRSIRNKKK